MGKGKKHDKLYITQSEWTNEWGGAKDRSKEGLEFKSLPFDCCALSLQPFDKPVATPKGNVYDVVNIIPFIKKYKVDPMTGDPLSIKDLIGLNFHKNKEEQYHCPVTYKVFNSHSHIVFIKTTGNVYSMEAIEQLNLKSKNMKDLLTEEKFTRSDIIDIQNPSNLEKRNYAAFHYVKLGLSVPKKESPDPLVNINVNATAQQVFKELKQQAEKEKAEGTEKKKYDYMLSGDQDEKESRQRFGSAYFTSSSFQPKLGDSFGVAIKKTRKKAYIRIVTNYGPLNFELHTDLAPRTCENFLGLCQKGYYDGVSFHRLIKNFMVQGGDPTGTGRGGESYWGKNFPDEFTPTLSHSERGVLSMANSGPNTNSSQFFILFKASKHLDNRHSVFGRLVGGMDTLKEIENIPTGKNDAPLLRVEIEKTIIFVNPFDDLAEEEEEIRKEEEEKKRKIIEEKEGAVRGQWYSNPSGKESLPSHKKHKVGRYLDIHE